MAPGHYQNGALWDWWAGWQMIAEFDRGAAELAREHLLALAGDWARHPGTVWEWQTVPGNEGFGPSDYAGAAGTVGQSIIAGLFGVRLDARELSLSPRLGDLSGYIRVHQPASGRYAAYRYSPLPTAVYLDYGVPEGPDQLALSVLMPPGREAESARVDGEAIEFAMQTLGRDRYVVIMGPPGIHRLELTLK
jgi:hypothetical protein